MRITENCFDQVVACSYSQLLWLYQNILLIFRGFEGELKQQNRP